MSPETIEDKKRSDEVDVWSMGVLLYYILYGKFPY